MKNGSTFLLTPFKIAINESCLQNMCGIAKDQSHGFFQVKKEGLGKNRLIFRWDPSHVYTKIMERSRGRWCMTDFLSTYLTSSREQHFSTATLLKEKKLHDFIKLIIISNVSFICTQSLLRISLGWNWTKVQCSYVTLKCSNFLYLGIWPSNLAELELCFILGRSKHFSLRFQLAQSSISTSQKSPINDKFSTLWSF